MFVLGLVVSIPLAFVGKIYYDKKVAKNNYSLAQVVPGGPGSGIADPGLLKEIEHNQQEKQKIE